MAATMTEAMRSNFLGNSPTWYKQTIIAFLVINPFLAMWDPFIAGWIIVLQFIFTLAMALKCYPLQPGGLIAIESILIGLTTPEHVFIEAEHNFPVILLLMFMVAGIYFLREMLLFVFTKILLGVRSKVLLSLIFSFTAAFLSAFLDALTVTAVIITVAAGFYGVYHKVCSGKKFDHDHDPTTDDEVIELHREDLENFRSFLRSLMMHGAVGTALGGVTTLVGEPQNLLIAEIMDWEFTEFFLRMAHISMPVLVVGLMTCAGARADGSHSATATEAVAAGARSSRGLRFDMSTKPRAHEARAQSSSCRASSPSSADHRAGEPPAEPGCRRPDGDRAGDGAERHYRGTPPRARVRGGAAVHGAARRVSSRSWPSSTTRACSRPVIDWVTHLRGQDPGGAVLHCQWRAVDDFGQRVRRDGLHHRGRRACSRPARSTVSSSTRWRWRSTRARTSRRVATPNGQAAFLFLLTSALAPLIRLVLRPHGDHGAAVHDHDEHHGPGWHCGTSGRS